MPNLLDLIVAGKDDHEGFYEATGPDKHTQEDHYQEGVSVVRMNVELLESWLDDQEDGSNYLEQYNHLPATERRKLWEASGFHFGIFGYDDADADFWWSKQS